MTTNELEIKYRKILDLKPYANSPRIHNRAKRQKLDKLLRRFGQIAPIITDGEGGIVDGHLVVELLKEIGHEKVATVEVCTNDPAEIRAIRLALNRVAQDAKWDNARLMTEFQELLDIGFDMSFTGFDQVEIDMTLSMEEPTSAITEDAPPAVDPDAVAVTRPGDLWVLGGNRVLCGDARDPAAMAHLFDGQTAQMVMCDPPYNVPIVGNVSGLGANHHREFAMASGEMTSIQFTDFLADFLTTACTVLADGAILFICMDWKHLPELFTATGRAGLTPMNLCVWAKTNAGMGTFYRSQHEMVLAAKHGTAPHINNFELGKKGRSRSNLWTYRGMNVPGQERDDLLKLHPTVKPVALVADAIKDVSHRGSIVLDSFLGSGTTLIAAETTGRRCYGIEYDPLYVDLIVRRWMDHTGGTAMLSGTGETFEHREEIAHRNAEATDQSPAGNTNGGI
ncbi:methyltransferase [Ferrigenium kumadai]|uniref:Methyltransferase n=1 Tax=Ferrigenium kumadai TaxID=1682490 RepID=A0AAN1SY44_9PROT|nr:DNA modification methylase [Ferrigenium kumadai]BBI98696.1 methyltransferase [Ferrigenium kumadai]